MVTIESQRTTKTVATVVLEDEDSNEIKNFIVSDNHNIETVKATPMTWSTSSVSLGVKIDKKQKQN